MLGLLLIITGTSWLYSSLLDIRTEVPLPVTIQAEQNKPLHYIGVVSRYSPYLIYEGYQPIMDYLSAHTGNRFEIKLGTSYEETIRQLVSGEVSAAFLGSFLYARYKKKYRLHSILQPLNQNGQPFFRSVLITAKDRTLQSIEEIKGKKLALPSPLSFSGNWLFNHQLCTYPFKTSDFDSIHYFGHHNTVVYQIIKGNFDVGVVKERVAKEFLKHGIKIIARSKAFPSSPLVISEHTPPALIQEITGALLNISAHDQTSVQIPQTWDEEFRFGFVRTRESDFDSLAAVIQPQEDR